MRVCCHFLFAALLPWGALRGPSRRRRHRHFERRFFLKNGARHRASVDEKKNHMHRHMIFRATVITTVVATIA